MWWHFRTWYYTINNQNMYIWNDIAINKSTYPPPPKKKKINTKSTFAPAFWNNQITFNKLNFWDTNCIIIICDLHIEHYNWTYVKIWDHCCKSIFLIIQKSWHWQGMWTLTVTLHTARKHSHVSGNASFLNTNWILYSILWT